MASDGDVSSAVLQGIPPAEVELDASRVRELLQAQHPDLAGLALHPADAGWDNAMFRLGESLAMRLPRRAAAAARIEREQRWLPEIARRLPLPVPEPLRLGMPAGGYPWRWSIVPWLRGTSADLAEPDRKQAIVLASALRALHIAAPNEAPPSDIRGVPLQWRKAAVEQRMQRLARHTDLLTDEIVRTWNAALEAPMDPQTVWIHGDLHPRNVIVDAGVISGIVDWGDLTSGDPATDLAAIWMLFDAPEARHAAVQAYDATATTWARARGWAVFFGVVLADTGLADQPDYALMGERTLRRVAEDA